MKLRTSAMRMWSMTLTVLPALLIGLARFHTIYIPAVPRDGIMSDWNLTYDVEASRAVLGSAAEVVILDISAGEDVDAPEFLSSLEGESLAGVAFTLKRPPPAARQEELY